MTAANKDKGNRFEQKIAKKFSAWSNKKFHRIPNSGALRWNDLLFTYGDLLCPSDLPCIIECKHYKVVNLFSIFADSSGVTNKGRAKPDIISWWKHQLMKDVSRCIKENGVYLVPILIFLQNNGKDMALMEQDFLDSLNVSISPRVNFSSPLIQTNMSLVKLDDLLCSVGYSLFVEKCVQYSNTKTDSIRKKRRDNNGRNLRPKISQRIP